MAKIWTGQHKPVATVIICAVLTGFFVAALFMPELSDELACHGADLPVRWWKAFTSGLSHSGIVHLLLNVVMIAYIGYKMERRCGSIWLAVVFIGGVGVGTALFMNMYAAAYPSISVRGASGGKCAMMAFFAAVFIYDLLMAKREDVAAVMMESVPVWCLIVFELFLSYMPNIAWSAHIGGVIVGVAAGLLWIALDWNRHDRDRQPSESDHSSISIE